MRQGEIRQITKEEIQPLMDRISTLEKFGGPQLGLSTPNMGCTQCADMTHMVQRMQKNFDDAQLRHAAKIRSQAEDTVRLKQQLDQMATLVKQQHAAIAQLSNFCRSIPPVAPLSQAVAVLDRN